MTQTDISAPRPLNIAWVTIGVADMAVARALWVGQLGLDVLAERQGPDAELARLWGIPADSVVSQLLVGTPGAATGRLHFVQFRKPGAAVRGGAAPTDPGAKNIDVNCTGMPAKVAALREAGMRFRSPISEYDVDGVRAREVQAPVHDALNLVLIEVLTAGFETVYTPQGYAALTSFVVIVPDAAREQQFYQRLFGMQLVIEHRLSGKAIEQAAGLPPGTVLDLRLLGDAASLFGRMEVIEYVGVGGDERFTRAVPPATGILAAGFDARADAGFLDRAAAAGVRVERQVTASPVFGGPHIAQLYSPAGLRLQVLVAQGPCIRSLRTDENSSCNAL